METTKVTLDFELNDCEEPVIVLFEYETLKDIKSFKKYSELKAYCLEQGYELINPYSAEMDG